MVLSVFASSRSRDHFTGRCPDIVSQGLLGAWSKLSRHSPLLNTITTQEKSEKPLKTCTQHRWNSEGVCSISSLVLRPSMKLAAGSGQAHVVKCSTQGGSHHNGFLETPCSLLPYFQEVIWNAQAKSALKTAQTVCQYWPLWSCAQIWVILYLLARTQKHATFRKKIFIVLNWQFFTGNCRNWQAVVQRSLVCLVLTAELPGPSLIPEPNST